MREQKKQQELEQQKAINE